MSAKLVIWGFLSGFMGEYHDALENGWVPNYTASEDLELRDHTIALLTHSSRHFDPLETTKHGVDAVVARMKRRGLPVFYLHDNANRSNPAWKYLYSDGRPTAFVPSDVGEFETDLSHVKHVVSLGGFYWCCQRTTLIDVFHQWKRDGADSHDFRVTQVVDGIFDVTEGIRSSDPYYEDVREYFFKEIRKDESSAAMSLSKILQLINDTDLEIDFVRRQLDTMRLPRDVDIYLDYFGREVEYRRAATSSRNKIKLASAKSASKKASREDPSKDEKVVPAKAQPPRVPRLTIAYRTSENFLLRRGNPEWLARNKPSRSN